MVTISLVRCKLFGVQIKNVKVTLRLCFSPNVLIFLTLHAVVWCVCVVDIDLPHGSSAPVTTVLQPTEFSAFRV